MLTFQHLEGYILPLDDHAFFDETEFALAIVVFWVLTLLDTYQLADLDQPLLDGNLDAHPYVVLRTHAHVLLWKLGKEVSEVMDIQLR